MYKYVYDHAVIYWANEEYKSTKIIISVPMERVLFRCFYLEKTLLKSFEIAKITLILTKSISDMYSSDLLRSIFLLKRLLMVNWEFAIIAWTALHLLSLCLILVKFIGSF